MPNAKKVIILSGGLGTRLSSLISDRPKVLTPVAGKPFIYHLILWLSKYNYKEIIFCVSYQASQVMRFIGDGKSLGIKPLFSLNLQSAGTGGAIKIACKKFIKNNEGALIINGDTFFDLNLNKFKEFHNQNNAFITIGLSHVLDVHRYGQVQTNANYQILEFKEKESNNKTTSIAGLVNGGVYLFSSEAVRSLEKYSQSFSIERDYFPNLIKNQRIFGYVSDTTHYDMGTPSGYRRTDKFLGGHEQIIVRSRAPMRISFGGSGTDVPPFDQKHGGCVLNSSINKYVYGLLRLREDRKIRIVSSDYHLSVVYDDIKQLKFDGNLDLIKAVVKRIDVNYGFELEIRSDVPPNSGLGSSASVCVAVIGLFNHLLIDNKMTKPQIAELAYQVETEDLKNFGGRQDQYAAVFGGFNFFEFNGNDFVKVSPLNIKKDVFLELERNTILAYIGGRKASGSQHDFNQISEAEKKGYLQAIKSLGYESYDSLTRGDLSRFGNILEETWELKKKAFPQSSNRHIESLYLAAKKAGAIGGRVVGAGGGGHIIFYCNLGTEHKVAKVLSSLDAKVTDFNFDHDGLQTWEI